MQKKRGISLIVLVITIIVMIILAAAIIISLNNSGIISKANKAVQNTNEQEVNHIASLAWSKAYLNGARTVEALTSAVNTSLTNAGIDTSKYVIEVTTKGVTAHDKNYWWVQDGLNITKGNVALEAGDLIQYNAGVYGYTGAWKVLGAEDGNLLIMSTEDVGTIDLYGLNGGRYIEGIDYKNTNYGLLNGISRMNELCEPYGSGIGAIGARSIKVEDIDKLTGYDKTTYKGSGPKLDAYGNKVTYSWDSERECYLNYTSLNGISGHVYNIHSNGFNYVDLEKMTNRVIGVNDNNIPSIVNTGYGYRVSITSSKASEMIIGTNNNFISYLTTSHFVSCESEPKYGLFVINAGLLSRGNTATSSALFHSNMKSIRAVVELSNDITIGEKDNTLGWSYTL